MNFEFSLLHLGLDQVGICFGLLQDLLQAGLYNVDFQIAHQKDSEEGFN